MCWAFQQPTGEDVFFCGTNLTLIEADLEKALSWQYRTLIFRAEALADVAREFNRYNHRQIVIADVELAGLPISGVFKVDDSDSLMEFLVHTGMAVTNSSNENLIILLKAET